MLSGWTTDARLGVMPTDVKKINQVNIRPGLESVLLVRSRVNVPANAEVQRQVVANSPVVLAVKLVLVVTIVTMFTGTGSKGFAARIVVEVRCDARGTGKHRDYRYDE